MCVGANGMAIAEVFWLSSVWAITLVAEVCFFFGCNSCAESGKRGRENRPGWLRDEEMGALISPFF